MDICLPVCGGVFFVSSWKYPLLILESFHLFVGVFHWTFSKNPPTINGNLPYPLAGCFKKFTVIYFTFTIIGNFWHESWRSVWNFFLTEENLLTIYGQQRVRTSYFSEKKYPSTIIGNLRHESKWFAWNFFSLWQRFSHNIWAIEGKNFYVPITYPQYYWKVSIALRGCLEKLFIALLLQLETFTVKLRIFRKRKMSLYNKGTFDNGIYKVVH